MDEREATAQPGNLPLTTAFGRQMDRVRPQTSPVKKM